MESAPRTFSAGELLDLFQKTHVVLFIGAAATKETLPDELCRLPWGCVVTSRNDTRIISSFSVPGREARIYFPENNLPLQLLSRKELPVLSLFPSEENLALKRQELQDLDDEEFAGDIMADAKKRLQVLQNILGGNRPNHLVIVGYDPDERQGGLANDIPRNDFLRFLRRDVPVESVHFYGTWQDAAEYKKLCELAERRGFTVNETQLASLLAQNEDLQPEDEDIFGEQPAAYSLYKDNRFVTLPPETSRVLNACWFATLLTERELHAVQAYGNTLQEKWFLNFLVHSSGEHPQWYGYLKRSEFYIPRHYEAAMETLIRQELAVVSSRNKPIYLMGDPGSSKSVELGALAVHTYQEHKYPVIFIHNNSVNLSAGTEDFDHLDALMQVVEHAGGEKPGRILLIWDCSSYRDVVSQAQSLTTALENRGRRFLLVCSAYQQNHDPTKWYTVSSDGTHIVETDDSDAEICRMKGTTADSSYWIRADRWMNEQERKTLIEHLRRFSSVSERFLQDLEDPAVSHDDLFQCLYEAIRELRPELEAGLDRERLIVGDYVKNVLSTLSRSGASSGNTGNTIGGLFEKYREELKQIGIDLDEIDAGRKAEEEFNINKKQIDTILERFNTCVAMFSRFKLNMPYSLAMYLLTPTEEEREGVKDDLATELYEIASKDLPWIRYEYDKGADDFVFLFRNTLEAEIFLSNVSGERQIDFTCEMLRYIGNTICAGEAVSELLVRSIQEFLRYMGPNSRYTPFKKKWEDQARDIQRHLDKVIDTLSALRRAGIPDRNGSFSILEITFRREYYGVEGWRILHGDMNGKDRDAYSKHRYEERLDQLDQAISLAQETVQRLNEQLADISYDLPRPERNFLHRQCNNLEVESANCSLEEIDVRAQYADCCKALGEQPQERWRGVKPLQSYSMTFQHLSSVIRADPVNGYAYNALFKSFEREYQRQDISDWQKLGYLSQIGTVVDDILFNGPESIQSRGSAGNDELGMHIDNIRRYQSKTTVTISAIEQRDEGIRPFLEFYDQMQATSDPTAVLLVARRELPQEMTPGKPLTKGQRKRVGKVWRFLNKEEHIGSVKSRPDALSFLVRVAWLYFEHAELDIRTECQVTHLTMSQWEHIRDLCREYIDLCRSHAEYAVQPWVVLLHVLSLIECGDEYGDALKDLNRLREETFISNIRMRVPFMLCSEDGEPWQFRGLVTSVKGKTGWMSVAGDANAALNTEKDIRFHLTNLNYPSLKQGTYLSEPVELGLGYTGLSAYTTAGRKRRQEESK